MALDPGSGAIGGSPESSGRNSPVPRQWRNQLGDEAPIKDKAYRRYASGVERALLLFETALEEWADYISFLNKLLKVLQTRPSSFTTVPAKALVAKRLSQCLNPALPSGVHQKALEVYNYIFTTIGKDGLSRDLPLYLPGLAPTLSFASLSVRSPYLDILETHFLNIDPRSLRPAMKSIVLALLPGLEDETSEDFERTLTLLSRFKEAIRPQESQDLGHHHASGDDFFWQCFFLASITSHSRRAGALAYLVRFLPALGPGPKSTSTQTSDAEKLQDIVTSPEPGLLVRSFASGLTDDQLLIQRGFLDLLVTHLPLNSVVLQKKVKSADVQLLLKAAVGVVIRRDMSLNRRLWAWLLGPEPAGTDNDQSENNQLSPSSRTTYFEDFGRQSLTRVLLDMIETASQEKSTERTRPYRICLSLMDRWEIGGLLVPEVFMPIVDSVRRFQARASSRTEFLEVLRSASVFFDGIESGLIYSEIFGLMAQAIGPGSLGADDRKDKLALVGFIIANFNIREEEMVTIHAPLTSLAILCMLEEPKSRGNAMSSEQSHDLNEKAIAVVETLLDLVPDRAFPQRPETNGNGKDSTDVSSLAHGEVLRKIMTFYVHEQGNLDATIPPFTSIQLGELLLGKTIEYVSSPLRDIAMTKDVGIFVRILGIILSKTPSTYNFDATHLVAYLLQETTKTSPLPFTQFSSMIQLATQMHTANRIDSSQLSQLVAPLVRQSWPFLSSSEPKYHVETARCLWQLQTALTSSSRDVEAAICSILAKPTYGAPKSSWSDMGRNARTFGVLWTHTLQDSSGDRRGSKTHQADHRTVPRLSGADHFQVMLAQPTFLVLDALLDERTQSYMIVKSWLNNMIGIDRLFLLFISKLAELPFLRDNTTRGASEKIDSQGLTITADDDLDLCLYYLRTLYNVLRCLDMHRAVLASKYVAFHEGAAHIRAGIENDEMTLQDFFIRVCMTCAMAETPPEASSDLSDRVARLQRFALTFLHDFLSNRYVGVPFGLDLDEILIGILAKSIEKSDAYVQVSLLDVVYVALKLAKTEHQASQASNQQPGSPDISKTGALPLTLGQNRPAPWPMPALLLKCLQSGLSSGNSQAVLDHWMSFLRDVISLFSDSVFQFVIPLVETFCARIETSFTMLRDTFASQTWSQRPDEHMPESTLIHLMNGLESVLALAHEKLLTEENRARSIKGPEQPQSLFGSMVSGVFQSEGPQSRSATANDRLTVHLAFHDAMRICYNIWSWGQGEEGRTQDAASSASFNYTSLRMRNRARRLMEHLFTAEILECLETVIDIWRCSKTEAEKGQVFSFLSSLDACRPRHSIPALFNSIYSRSDPGALDPSRKSTLAISLQDVDLVVFLVEYSRSLDDDAMDEIWQDCITFLKDLMSNPFPHRQTLPSLLQFAGILGEKVDNTNFGEQKRMRRELGDLFLRLLTALFTTRPLTFTESGGSAQSAHEKSSKPDNSRAVDATDDVVSVMASIVPSLPKILLESDRVLSAAATMSTNVIGPTLRSKSFPQTVSAGTVRLLAELARLPNNQKTWRRDVGDAFNDNRFFGMDLAVVEDGWLSLLKQWASTDEERMLEMVSRIGAPTTAGIVFGVGATSARLDADRKTQFNLRRIATLILAGADDGFVGDVTTIMDKLVDLLAATSTSSPSSATRADIYMVIRALVLKTSPIHLAMIWPVVNAEMHAAISAVVAPDHSTASDTHLNTGILQACKLLDVLVCVAPDDFQLHEWLFITDTIEAVHRSSSTWGHQPVALVDEISEELGVLGGGGAAQTDTEEAHVAAGGRWRRPLLGAGGISDEIGLDRKDELVAKVLRPFFSQLSIFAFESTYAMGSVDRETCIHALLRDLFDERTVVKSL